MLRHPGQARFASFAGQDSRHCHRGKPASKPRNRARRKVAARRGSYRAERKSAAHRGSGKGEVLWKDLAVTATVVSANKKGILSLPKDPRVSDGKTGQVTVTVPSHPGISANLDIPLRYNVKFVSSYSGTSGTSGTNGTDGIDGIGGSPGSMDPNNPSPGGDGTNGSDGSNGGDGGDGGDGPPVQVF